MGILAITGGNKIKSKPFPDYPIISEEDDKAVLKALHSRRWARSGNDSFLNPNSYKGFIEQLEQRISELHSCKYALAVTSGTTALELAVQAIEDIRPGDEVIVTPYSFIASASCILKAGAVPVFADINKDTWNIDSYSIEKCITSKTKAILLVHFAGQSSDMDAIRNLAQRHNLKIIEDAAHALGAYWGNEPVGSNSDITCFSLQSSKNTTCGEGGVLITNNIDYYKRAFSLHMAGRAINGKWYQHEILGSNYRITELQAALACSQLNEFQERENKRKENAEYLISCLKEIEGIEPTITLEKAGDRVYHLFTFSYKKEQWRNLSKMRFLMALNAEGIECQAGYEYPLYKNPLFKLYEDYDYSVFEKRCPVAENVCREAVWLPQSLLLGDRQDMDEIAGGIKKIRDNLDELKRK